MSLNEKLSFLIHIQIDLPGYLSAFVEISLLGGCVKKIGLTAQPSISSPTLGHMRFSACLAVVSLLNLPPHLHLLAAFIFFWSRIYRAGPRGAFYALIKFPPNGPSDGERRKPAS